MQDNHWSGIHGLGWVSSSIGHQRPTQSWYWCTIAHPSGVTACKCWRGWEFVAFPFCFAGCTTPCPQLIWVQTPYFGVGYDENRFYLVSWTLINGGFFPERYLVAIWLGMGKSGPGWNMIDKVLQLLITSWVYDGRPECRLVPCSINWTP